MSRLHTPWFRIRARRPAAGAAGLALVIAQLSTADPAGAQPAAPEPAAPAGGEEERPLAGPTVEPQPEGAELTEDPLADALRPSRGGWTPDRVAARAIRMSPAVATKQAELQAAAAKVDKAIVAYFPIVSTSFTYTRLSPVEPFSFGASIPGMGSGFSFPVLLNSWSWSTTVTVPFSDYLLRITQMHAAARAGEDSRRLEARAEELKTAADAKVAYLNWLRARGQRAVAQMAVAATQAHVADAKITLEAGLLSRADLLRLESQLAQAESLAHAAQAFESVASEQLHTILRLRPGEQLSVGIDVFGNPPAVDTRPLPELQRIALENRLEIQALRAAKRSLVETENVAVASYFPRLDGFLSLDYANPNQRIFPSTERWEWTWALGARASWTLNDTFSTIGAHRELDANVRVLEEQQRSLEDGIKLSVAAAYYDAVRARSNIEAARRGEEAAEESLRVRRDLLRAGKATATEIIDAETALTQARLNRVDAHVDLLVSLAKLQYAMGLRPHR